MHRAYEATFCPVDTWRSMMSESQRKTYRPWEPQRYRQEAQSPDAKLPEGDVVFFLLDLVPQLDVRRFYAPYEDETRGAPPFDPAMMVCLLVCFRQARVHLDFPWPPVIRRQAPR